MAIVKTHPAVDDEIVSGPFGTVNDWRHDEI